MSGKEQIGSDADINVSGWAADKAYGTPVKAVVAYIDGAVAGDAVLGFDRSDVAKYYGRTDYLRSGWSFGILGSTLGAGSHWITAVAVGKSGSSQLPGARIVTIMPHADQSGGRQNAAPGFGYIDGAGSSDLTPSVSATEEFYVRGWAADRAAGAPVAKVTIYVDGSAAGDARLGMLRDDVARHYRKPEFAKSGWEFHEPASRIQPGAHQVTVEAKGTSGATLLPGARSVTVRPKGQ